MLDSNYKTVEKCLKCGIRLGKTQLRFRLYRQCNLILHHFVCGKCWGKGGRVMVNLNIAKSCTKSETGKTAFSRSQSYDRTI